MNRIQRALLRLAGVKARPSEFMPNWQDGKPAPKPWSADKAYREGARSSSVVATALDWRGALSSVPLKAYRRTADGYEEAPDSPLQRLLSRPNAFMSAGFLVRRISDHVLLGGNALLLKNRGATKRAPLELWPLRPSDVTPIMSKTEFLAGYELVADGKKVKLPTTDVVHVMRQDPSSDYWGVGVLQAGSETIENERAAIAWQTTLLHRQAITSGVLGVGEELSEEAWLRLKAEMDQRRLGEARAGETIFIDGVGTLNYSRIGLNVEEMALVDTRRLTREDIMSMFQVPPPLMGYLERANYSNIETARRIFWQDTLIPFGQLIAQVFTSSLAPDFGPEWVVDFDFSQVDALQENLTEKLANFRSLLDAGIRPEVAAEYLDLGLRADAFVVQQETEGGVSDPDAAFAERIERTDDLAKALNASRDLGISWAHIITGGAAITAPGAYLAAAAPPPQPIEEGDANDNP